jgi:2',3'-cyclic-nucleotide 2'-phosphodiesterase (5'-nucleotidase family)
VVLITHCGFDKDRELARQFPKLRLILGGHSHTALRTGFLDGDTWIVQSAGRTSAISRIDLAIDRRRRRLVVERVGLVPLDSKRALEDPATKRFLAATFAHIGPKWDQPVGVVRGARDRRARGSTASTPAGNYVADLIRRAANVDVGVMNKGGIRSVLAHGAITRRQIFQLLPFDNTVFVADLTGAQLRKLLAEGLRSGCQPLEVGGARYSFAVVDGRRELRQIEVGGAPLQAARVYQVATNSFLAGGGDGFTVFAGLAPRRVSSDYLRAIMLSELRRTGVVQLSDDRRIRLVE